MEKYIIVIKSKINAHKDDSILVNTIDDIKIQNGFFEAYENGKKIYAYATAYIKAIEIKSSLEHPTIPLDERILLF